ncbi:hypothetical protein [Candidatus Nitrospira inopinata]|jgi:hypothetical protein|uniref:DprA winged helix domain-containing protein n=1 Tax=Candidatus Nitrospira inopinata TaxID=1715989 RepID=A0A0S4KRV8_9BACT|nr:hypothetical protein [Candidatus Nitrospira inopinata]CUQ66757.1 protein of unknown function [Candidatus Nitrospira inopinata]
MSIATERTEARILTIVHARGTISLEELLLCLPEWTWSQVFTSVDALSRQGAICLRRRNFEYELRPASPRPAAFLESSEKVQSREPHSAALP